MKNLMVILILAIFSLVSSSVFGQVSFTQYGTLPFVSSLDVAMISISDMNNDSQENIVSIYGFSTSSGSNYFLKISTVHPVGTITSIDYQLDCSSTIRNFEILDANNDGMKDIVYVHSDSVTILFQGGMYNFNTANQLTMFSGFTSDGIAKGDFNQDGLDDFVVSNWNGTNLRIFKQSTNINLIGYYIEDIAATQAGYNQVKVWDVNFDGWDDIVYLAGQGMFSGIYVYLNNGSGFFTSFPSYFPVLGSAGNTLVTSNVSFGDFFGTGPGLIINSCYGGPDNTRFIQYQTSGNWVNMGLTNMADYFPSSVVADFDNNGIDEVVYLANSLENVRVMQFSGLSSFTSTNFQTISGNYHAYDQMLATGDIVNNDDNIDFALISDWGEITIFTNNGNTITGIKYPSFVSNIDIYPNPTTDYLQVSLNEIGEYKWIITDVSGRIILENKNDEQNFIINLESIPSGIYFLKIEGKEFFSKKFIVQ
ncbi:T9SS type A sorting domain-containing protein [Candidatus Gracilibacteria bacterium]|nr:T9SS type A sorting domain-containing protein [Candidatus Gracilibacteria bacterium]